MLAYIFVSIYFLTVVICSFKNSLNTVLDRQKNVQHRHCITIQDLSVLGLLKKKFETMWGWTGGNSGSGGVDGGKREGDKRVGLVNPQVILVILVF